MNAPDKVGKMKKKPGPGDASRDSDRLRMVAGGSPATRGSAQESSLQQVAAPGGIGQHVPNQSDTRELRPRSDVRGLKEQPRRASPNDMAAFFAMIVGIAGLMLGAKGIALLASAAVGLGVALFERYRGQPRSNTSKHSV